MWDNIYQPDQTGSKTPYGYRGSRGWNRMAVYLY